MSEILVVDDHAFARNALKRQLSADGRYYIFEASSGDEALAFVRKRKIDLVILDVQMPGMSGIEVLKTLKKLNPKIKIIVLTQLDEYLLVPYVIRLGADSFLSKSSAELDEISVAVQTTLEKGEYISRAMSQALKRSVETGSNGPGRLSPRERQVLTLLSKGKTNKEIAVELNLEVSTIESYRKKLMDKIDCKNTAELVLYAFRIGEAVPK